MGDIDIRLAREYSRDQARCMREMRIMRWAVGTFLAALCLLPLIVAWNA